MKHRYFSRLREYLDKLFLVDFIRDKVKLKDEFIMKYLRVTAKFSEGFYVFFILMAVSNVIFTLQIEALVGVIIISILFPLLYRVIMGIQFKVHNIKKE
jgi:hypothetical protein